ncbi:hypothetical protein C0J52_09476 [Blattella germanica]|nr:hypothetical protein C0J52_09476 [Blattella germanica]
MQHIFAFRIYGRFLHFIFTSLFKYCPPSFSIHSPSRRGKSPITLRSMSSLSCLTYQVRQRDYVLISYDYEWPTSELVPYFQMYSQFVE